MIRQLLTLTGVMLAMDAVWLTSTAAASRQMIATLQGKPMQIRWIAAAAVYALMVGAAWFFAVEPSTSWKDAASRGALLGLVMYGLYDLTNYATLTAYPLWFALQDMAWGTFLFAVASGAAAALTA